MSQKNAVYNKKNENFMKKEFVFHSLFITNPQFYTNYETKLQCTDTLDMVCIDKR